MARPLQELIILLFLVITCVAFYVSWRTDGQSCVWKTIDNPTCTPGPGQVVVWNGKGWEWVDGPEEAPYASR